MVSPALAQRGYGPLQARPRIVVRPQGLVQSQPMQIMTGTPGGTFVRLGDDLSDLMRRSDFDLRAVNSHGSFDNVRRLLTMRGVDLALAASDTLAYARRQPELPGLEQIRYIAKLGTNDLHVVARDPGIQTAHDLAGKRVVVDVADSGTAVTAPFVLRASGIEFDPVFEPPRRGLAMLQQGDADALCYGIGRPGDLFMALPQGTVHFVSVPMAEALASSYLPIMFTAADYPNLIAEGQQIEGIAVGVALACFGWPANSERYPPLERFVRLFVEHFADLRKAPYHLQWRGVNLAATLPGWTRFAPVETTLKAAQDGDEAAFGTFLTSVGRTGVVGAERERLQAVFQSLRSR